MSAESASPHPAASLSAPRALDSVQAIAAYVPGRATGDDGRALVKLSANENPLGCSPLASAAAIAAAASLNRYPDPGADALRAAIGQAHGLEPERIVCGTGSDEVLHMVATAYSGPGDENIHVQFGFMVYDIATRSAGATPVMAPARDYGTDVDALLACVTPRTRVVYVANPNNPTGTFMPRTELERLHRGLRSDILLVLDQAYAEYLAPEDDDGGLELACRARNVLVTRTFSKIHGLAAERIGWGYGDPAIIDMLHRVRGPFNVTHIGQAAAAAAIGDSAFVTRARDHNRRWRDWLSDEMTALGNHGVRVVPSEGNFLLVLFEGAVNAEQVNAQLMGEGYAVRWLPGMGLGHGLRITIGDEGDMRRVAGIIRDAVAAA